MSESVDSTGCDQHIKLSHVTLAQQNKTFSIQESALFKLTSPPPLSPNWSVKAGYKCGLNQEFHTTLFYSLNQTLVEKEVFSLIL